MAANSYIHRGVVHGASISLERETGYPEGQQVTVSIQPVAPEEGKLPPGEGLRRSFGAWADEAEELDKFLEWNRRHR